MENCFIYLDDCLVFHKDKKSHDETVEKIFKILAENNMALSIDKCTFGKNEVDYLGYRVTSTGIRPLPRKLEALRQFQPPQSQKDVAYLYLLF